MRNKIVKRISVFFALAIILIITLGIFTGCQSTDKSKSYLNTEPFKHANLEYDSATNATKVSWIGALENQTIYNISGFSVTFKLGGESSSANTATYTYDIKIKHGKDFTNPLSFIANGKITSVEYVSWHANYSSFWDTYKAWFIVTIVVTIIASIICVIIIIVNDLDLDDTIDFFEDNAWSLPTLLITFLSFFVWNTFALNWVPILIVLGGIIIFALILLVAHLIKYIADFGDCFDCFDDIDCSCFDGCFGAGRHRGNEYLREMEEIESNSSNREALMTYSVEQLRNYCQMKEINGYSSLKNPTSLI